VFGYNFRNPDSHLDYKGIVEVYSLSEDVTKNMKNHSTNSITISVGRLPEFMGKTL